MPDDAKTTFRDRRETVYPHAEPMTLTLDHIKAAASRLSGHIERTPCRRSRTLSEITGAEVWVKFENLQFTAGSSPPRPATMPRAWPTTAGASGCR